MSIDPHFAPHSARALAPWMRWVEERLKYLASGRNLIDRGSVDGGVVTIHEILTNPTTTAWWNDDTAVVTGSGPLTMYLTHVPLPGSLNVFWEPLHIPRANWTLDGNVLTIEDPGWLVDDLVGTSYRYDTTGAAPVPAPPPVEPPPPSGVLVDFQASGWKHLQVARTAATDYSSPTFDDSAWDVAPAPFGASNPVHTPPAGWPDYVTVWAQATRMWARRTLTTTPATAASISMRWNRDIVVFWNGVQVYAGTGSAGAATVDIPASSVTGTDKLAIRATDDAFVGAHTGCYFDAKVEQ